MAESKKSLCHESKKSLCHERRGELTRLAADVLEKIIS